MFRPTPSMITDTGEYAVTCASPRKSGVRSPGTLEITMLNGGLRTSAMRMAANARDACAAKAGVPNY